MLIECPTCYHKTFDAEKGYCRKCGEGGKTLPGICEICGTPLDSDGVCPMAVKYHPETAQG